MSDARGNGVFAILILRVDVRTVREDSTRDLEMSFQRSEIQWSHIVSPKVSPHQCIDVGTVNEKLRNNLITSRLPPSPISPVCSSKVLPLHCLEGRMPGSVVCRESGSLVTPPFFGEMS